VEAARAAFAASRLQTKHSGDALLRLQAAKAAAARGGPPPPPAPTAAAAALPAGAAVPGEILTQSLRAGLSFYQTLQAPDGHFPGDYGGPMFLLPGLLVTLHVTGALERALGAEARAEMVRYLVNHANADGGYGLLIEGESTMFGTVLSYVSLRLLGVEASQPTAAAARAWLLARGGATHIPSWGKFWLAVLGVYEWHGLNPMPPEMWLLPYALPMHPGRMWCHCRMVYLPMCYVYGVRAVGPQSELTQALRSELYPAAGDAGPGEGPYGGIDWDASRSRCAKEDLYYPHPLLQDAIWYGLSRAEPLLLGSRLRRAALRKVMAHIHYEDENTRCVGPFVTLFFGLIRRLRYVDIGPVNKVINMLCCWLEDPEGPAFRAHLARVADYLWVAEDGMKMQGYNGSQLWDTAFAMQAALSSGLACEYPGLLRSAYAYLDASQVREDCAPPLRAFYRHISKGAWPFSTRDHGWPISDCTAEGLKAALLTLSAEEAAAARGEGEAEADADAEALASPRRSGRVASRAAAAGLLIPGGARGAISAERLEDCVNIILSFQNADGGWATYENTRSWAWLELLNPAETFGDIMIDYTYVECTSASIQALRLFLRRYPGHRAEEVNAAISAGVYFILRTQRPDGSWYGSWGVCFTYGCWFGILGLTAAGLSWNGTGALKRAVAFLLSTQCADGGWGESYLSCQDKQYSQLGSAHAVNTSWALLALLASGQAARDPGPLHAAAAALLRLQLPNGDWPQQRISGVFNRNCMITYANYRNIFPIWALGEVRSARCRARICADLCRFSTARRCGRRAWKRDRRWIFEVSPAVVIRWFPFRLLSRSELAGASAVTAVVRIDCGVAEAGPPASRAARRRRAPLPARAAGGGGPHAAPAQNSCGL